MDLVYPLALFVATIVITRIFLWFWPRHAPKIGNFQLHHYMYGLVLIAIYFGIPQIALLVVGLGLVVDEIPLFFIFKGWDWPDDHWGQYHSYQSILSIIAMSLVASLVIYFL